MLKNLPLIWLAKFVSIFSKLLNKGSGSTWPGHILITANEHFLEEVYKQFNGDIIFVTGTNGKTTTVKLINTFLGKDNVVSNPSGANLLNGTASAFINNMNWLGKINKKYAVLEIDEAALLLLLKKITPKMIIGLNLFRDQLDRYGEVDSIARKWKAAFNNLPKTSTIILNADDPQMAFLGQNIQSKVKYFGIEDKTLYRKMEHATDSIFCPECSARLVYAGMFFSHLGHWSCNKCGLTRPKVDTVDFSSPLPGIYIKYDVLAAVLTAHQFGINDVIIKEKLKSFTPAFGRQEELFINGKKVKIILSKNPTGFNQSLNTVLHMDSDKKNYIFALNDLEQDGKDISWIWDVDFEDLSSSIKNLTITGTRAEDMSVRTKYADLQIDKFSNNLKEAINFAVKNTAPNETLYIMATYTAMLEIRKLLLGRKLL